MTETFIHIAMRKYLKENKWILIAGEYPNGSDDELSILNIQDPELARDNSPNPRKHSLGEITPDLIAYKDGVILIVEAKVKYSLKDKQKLVNLLSSKKNLLIDSLEKFSMQKNLFSEIDYRNATYIPTLAYENQTLKAEYFDQGFAHIYVKSMDEIKIVFFKNK